MGLADQTCGFRLLPLGYLGPHTLLQLAGLELEDPQVYRPTLCAARLRATQKAPAEEGLGAMSLPSGPCPHFLFRVCLAFPCQKVPGFKK